MENNIELEEKLISFETAKLAKKKGFNVHCRWYFDDENGDLYENEDFPYNSWNGSLFAPTQSLLQKWLREVHSIHIEVLPRYQPKKLNTEEVLYSWAISCKPFDKYDGHNDVLNHWIGIHNGAPYIEDIFYHVVKTYEEALEVGLYQALLLI